MSGMKVIRICFLFLGLLVAMQPGCSTKPQKIRTAKDDFQLAANITDARRRANRMLQIAQQQGKKGETGDAAKSVGSGMDAALKVEDLYERCRILNRAIFIYSSIGYGHRIDELPHPLKYVAGEVEKIEDLGKRIEISAQLAEIYKKFMEKNTTAEMYLEECEKWAGQIESLDEGVRALMVIAYYCHRMGHDEDSERLVMAALEKATTVEGGRPQAEMYGELGTRLLRLNRKEQALTVFGIAEEGADAVEEDLSRAYAYLDLAQRLKAKGDADGCSRLLGAAEKIAERESQGAITRELLEKIRAER
jgi:tetratricopeptide (TPR) repeat protein